MGHKVHPYIFRMGSTTQWPSRWFARKDGYRTNLKQDIELREFFKKQLKDAALNRVDIERSRATLTIILHTAKPGVVIGRSGTGIDDLKKKVLKKFFPATAKTTHLNLSVLEVARPGLESNLVAQNVIGDLERRMPFRRVLKSTLERIKKAGALGAKVVVSGRLNGAEIARTEKLSWGKIPLTNLRADIDYYQSFAKTMAGVIGVKVWIYRGEMFEQDRMTQYLPNTPARPARGGDRGDYRSDNRGGMGGGRPGMNRGRGFHQTAPAVASAPSASAPAPEVAA